MNNQPVEAECTVNVPAGQVWAALTDPDQMREWYFDIPEFRPEAGFEFSFYGGPPERSYLHLCKITQVIPGQMLQYSWRYDGFSGNSLVTFRITVQESSTRLSLKHEGLDSFPETEKDFARSNFEGGWNYLVGDAIVAFLQGQ